MRVNIKMIDPSSVEGGGSTLYAVNLIAFSKEKLGQIRTVLTCNSGDHRTLRGLSNAHQAHLPIRCA
jgi:hypothetical protein